MHIQQEVTRGSDVQIKVSAQSWHRARTPQTILLSLENRGMGKEIEFPYDPVITLLVTYPKG